MPSDLQSTAVKLSRSARRDTQHQNGKPAGVLGPLTAEQRMYAALVSATVQALLVPSREALQEAAAQLGTQGQPQALNPAEPPFPRLEMENAIEIMCREFSRRQNDPPDQVMLLSCWKRQPPTTLLQLWPLRLGLSQLFHTLMDCIYTQAPLEIVLSFALALHRFQG